MKEQEIREYIAVRFPEENESCEWKEYKNLQNSLCGHEADDVVSYVSAIANMNGGSLIIGVEDKTFRVIGIQSLGSYNVESAKARIAEKCRNLPLEDFDIMELKAEDTEKVVWVLTIPKHRAKLPVYAHNKAWQRTGESFDDEYFRKLILNYLEKFGTASRKDIDLLIKDKLSDVLSEEQKKNKIYNLMRQLRISGKIVWGKNKLWKLV